MLYCFRMARRCKNLRPESNILLWKNSISNLPSRIGKHWRELGLITLQVYRMNRFSLNVQSSSLKQVITWTSGSKYISSVAATSAQHQAIWHISVFDLKRQGARDSRNSRRYLYCQKIMKSLPYSGCKRDNREWLYKFILHVMIICETSILKG